MAELPQDAQLPFFKEAFLPAFESGSNLKALRGFVDPPHLVDKLPQRPLAQDRDRLVLVVAMVASAPPSLESSVLVVDFAILPET